MKLNVSITQNSKGGLNKSSTAKPASIYILGCIPLVSTISGISQALLGIVHAIVHLVNAIFRDNWTHHLKEARIGLKHVALGSIAAFPIIGNICMIVFSALKCANLRKRVDVKNVLSNYTVGNYEFEPVCYGSKCEEAIIVRELR